MLTPGNKKLGGARIWGFALPSGSAGVCVGLTPTCARHRYAVRLEAYRKRAAARYRKNLALTRRRDFGVRVQAFLTLHGVRVVRIHTGGEFYSAEYAAKWLEVIRRRPKVRFYAYTRAWRIPAICTVLDELAREPNCRLWFSCDRDTGAPAERPLEVRIAWLMTGEGDPPPPEADLVFRVGHLRRIPLVTVAGVPVCPAEDGLPRATPMTCDRCRTCWRPAPRQLHEVLPCSQLGPDAASSPTGSPG